MKATIRTVNISFWKSWYGPFFAFIFPVLYTFIICSLWDLAGQISPVLVLPGCFITIVIALALISIPVTLNDLRHSVLFKRIGASQISHKHFFISTIVYYYLIILLSYCWQALWSIFILWKYKSLLMDMYYQANYWEVLYSVTITYLLSLSMGLFLLTFCKHNFQIQIIAIAIIVISIPLAGLGVPIVLIHNFDITRPSTSKVVYADPLWYVSSMHYESWFARNNNYANVYGSSIFDPGSSLSGKTIIANPNIHTILNITDKLLNLFCTIGLILILGIYSMLRFKWNMR